MNFVLNILVFVFVITFVEVKTEVSRVRGRIFGGAPVTRYNQFPSQVRLRITKGDKIGNCCGTVIDRNWILTAAHCVDGVNNIDMFLGSIRRDTVDLHLRSNVIKIHEGYDRNAIRNDIALIRTENITFTEHIQPANLPDANTPPNLYDNQDVIISGWGRTEQDSSPMQLQFTTMRTMSNGICIQEHSNSDIQYMIEETNICANGKNSRTCIGDSGTAMYTKDRKRTLIAMSSYGSSEGCDVDLPRIYTRITSYIDWINKIKSEKPSAEPNDRTNVVVTFEINQN